MVICCPDDAVLKHVDNQNVSSWLDTLIHDDKATEDNVDNKCQLVTG